VKIPAPYQRKRARIEIIPLIDIMFFLLATFVMVSLSMVKNQGIVVRLPAAESGAPVERSHAVRVSVDASGTLLLDREAVSLPALRERLRALKLADPELSVFINGDERADFGLAVSVLDEVRLLGIAKVTVQTRRQAP
jgi:biopolymer transport protein ExbD